MVVNGAAQFNVLVAMLGDIDSTIVFVWLVIFFERFNQPCWLGDVPFPILPVVYVIEGVLHIEIILEGEKLGVGDYGNGVTEDYGIAASASNFW